MSDRGTKKREMKPEMDKKILRERRGKGETADDWTIKTMYTSNNNRDHLTGNYYDDKSQNVAVMQT